MYYQTNSWRHDICTNNQTVEGVTKNIHTDINMVIQRTSKIYLKILVLNINAFFYIHIGTDYIHIDITMLTL